MEATQTVASFSGFCSISLFLLLLLLLLVDSNSSLLQPQGETIRSGSASFKVL